MERYVLEEIMSGQDQGCVWVTLGFSSKREKNDVLHIVCAEVVTEQDRRNGTASLYLERLDQGEACYSPATSVLVTRTSVEVRLNKKDAGVLVFKPGVLYFEVPRGLSGFDDAFKTLKQMSTLECGKKVCAVSRRRTSR